MSIVVEEKEPELLILYNPKNRELAHTWAEKYKPFIKVRLRETSIDGVMFAVSGIITSDHKVISSIIRMLNEKH